jgi:hypothetical protein
MGPPRRLKPPRTLLLALDGNENPGMSFPARVEIWLANHQVRDVASNRGEAV